MIGKQIKLLRKELSLTQKDFGQSLDKSMTTVQNWEYGESTPPAPTIKLICSQFNVNSAWLFSGEGEMFQSETGSYTLNEKQKELVALLQFADDKFIQKCIDYLKKQKQDEENLFK